MAENRLALHTKFTAHTGKRDELVNILIQAAELLANNPECIHYIVNVVPDEPDVLWVAELWANEDAHAASLRGEEVRALVQRALPLIAGPPQQVRLVPVGGKNLD